MTMYRSGLQTFRAGAVCRYFRAPSGRSQRRSLVILPIKVFSKKKKGCHLNSESYFSILSQNQGVI